MPIKIHSCGYPLLHIAAYKGETEIVKWLLDRGVDINLTCVYGVEPDLNLDSEKGYETIVKTLTESTEAPNDKNSLFNCDYFFANSNFNRVSALHLASKQGHLETVKILIERGAKVNALTMIAVYAGMPLHQAAAQGHKEIVEFLIQHGADLDAVDIVYGNTALHLAGYHGHFNVIKTLISKGANINKENQDQETVLHKSAKRGNKRILEILIESGVDINAENCIGETALHRATEYGNKEFFDELVQRGATLDTEGRHWNYETMLQIATRTNNEDFVKMLIESVADPINARELDCNKALFKAVEIGSREIVKMLIDCKADVNFSYNGVTLLHMAAKKGNEELVKLLLKHGADCNIKTRLEETVLHSAAAGGNEQIAKIFIKRGVDVNSKDEYGDTSLHVAAERGNTNIMKVLFKHGAIVNLNDCAHDSLVFGAVQTNAEVVKMLMDRGCKFNGKCDREGNSALHKAAENGTVEIVKLLIDNGAKVNVKCDKGQTALHKAVGNGKEEIVKLLIEHGAKVNARCRSKETPLHKAAEAGVDNENIIDSLIKRGAQLNAKNSLGETAMHVAIQHENEELVKIILDRGAAVNVPNSASGETALHMAIKKKMEKLVTQLLIHGADINLQDFNGETALHEAVKCENEDIVKELILKGATIDVKDSSGYTPLYLACGCRYGDIAKLLLNAGVDINSIDNQGDTVLANAVKNHSSGCIKFLLDCGSTVDICTLLLQAMEEGTWHFDEEDIFDSCFNKELYGTPKRLIELLLDYGTNFNKIDKDVSAILSRAVEEDNETMVQLLLEYQANINFENTEGASIIRQALNYRSYSNRCTEILTRHAVRMKLENLFVSEKILQDVDSDVNLQVLKVKCENEIERMKECVDDGINYWKVLTFNHSLVYFARNNGIVQAVNSDECRKKFPLYSSILKNQIRRGVWRNILLDKVKYFFKAVAKSEGNERLPVLPRLCVDEIFSYLPNRDFRNLIKVCDPNKRFDFNLINVK